MELATGVVALLDFLAVEAVNQATAIQDVPNPVPDEVIDGERVPNPVK
jgi:hypothetical protein